MLRTPDGDAPGPGVDVDETKAERYACKLGNHPIVRLADGTLSDY